MFKSDIRPAAVAGRFYPGEPRELRGLIESLLAEAQRTGKSAEPVAPGEPTALGRAAPKAMIAPHAGYVYSGPIAASAYARLAPAADVVKRVVLMGPSHFVPVRGLAASSATAFATPLGAVPVDVEAVRRLQALPQVKVLNGAHGQEHSLEVQLPFLQVVLRQFSVVPLVVGDATPEEIGQVLEAVWGGPETRLVISSDLSHYLDSDSARRMDAATARAIENLRPEDISGPQACGRLPICGLLQAARRHGLRAQTVDLRNSGDTAGRRAEVVGYGAFVFEGA